MKKKWLALAVSGLLTASFAFGLAGCGKGNDQGTTNPPDGGNEPNSPEDLTYDVEAAAFETPTATINVNGTANKERKSNKISDTLFGVFLEDINYASYALDDNLLANYSFETPLTGNTKNTYAWSTSSNDVKLTVAGGAGGVLGEAYKNYKNEYVNSAYANVSVPAAGGSIYNEGFKDPGMAVTQGTNYTFSAFIKAPSAFSMSVRVVDNKSNVYAEGVVEVGAEDNWVKYEKTITATRLGIDKLKFEMKFEGAATFSMDAVKLETQDATLGIKNYIYNAVKELEPKFIRFPGGCVIEGVNDATAYDWKNSVGAVAKANGDEVPEISYKLNKDGVVSEEKTRGEQIARRANTDIWYANGVYYEMEYGLGFYDYFMLCDSLGASPVPVISCGLSDQGGLAYREAAHELTGRHGNGKADYIQDAKDLILFAKGSTSSSDANEKYWAQLRTDMGHPEPFDLQYLGIGNEQNGAYHTSYYQKFIEAFNDKSASDYNPLFQSVKLIVGNNTAFSHCEQVTSSGRKDGQAQKAAKDYKRKGGISTIAEYGVHDQHYYMNYLDFFKNTGIYDEYYREETDPEDYYEVFVGEYSANSYGSAGESYEAKSEWTNSWITALSEAAMMTAYERNGDIIKLAAYAPMFASWVGERQWKVDMMYFTNTELVRSTNYYVQQLFMKSQGQYKLVNTVNYASGFQTTYSLASTSASSKKEDARSADISKLYISTALDKDGNIVVKIVNASNEDIPVNIAVTNAELKGVGTTYVLQNDNYKAVNTLDEEAIKPKTEKIGGFTDKVGYTAKKYSVAAITLKVK